MCYRLRLVPIVGFLVVLERLRLVQTPILDLAGMRDFETAVSDAQYLDRAIDRLEKTQVKTEPSELFVTSNSADNASQTETSTLC